MIKKEKEKKSGLSLLGITYKERKTRNHYKYKENIIIHHTILNKNKTKAQVESINRQNRSSTKTSCRKKSEEVLSLWCCCLLKFNAATILRRGLLGCTFDSVRTADPKPKSVRGDHRRASSPDHNLYSQSLSSYTPCFFSYPQLYYPLNQVDSFSFNPTINNCINLRPNSIMVCLFLVGLL